MKPYFETSQVTLYQGDCLEVMPQLESQSFDAIICDLPYGTTACSWDVVIPFEPLWEQYKRLIKPNGAIVLFGSQPFTTDLIMSNRKWFKYELIWEKSLAVGFQNANFQPLKSHENIIVFSSSASTFTKSGSMKYNPQLQPGEPYEDKRSDRRVANLGHRAATTLDKKPISNDGFRYPRSVLKFANPNNNAYHPTQKPVDLMSHLIQSYTNPGDRILDNTCGSGTTLVAARDTGRNAVGIELDPKYCEIAAKRCQQLTIFGVA